jgi:uncharacterized repeat protein (TIGR02543 family)
MGVGNGRSILNDYYPPNDPEKLKRINYKITLSGNGTTIHIEAKGGDTIRATVAMGQWNVKIDAYIIKTQEEYDNQALDGYNVGDNIPFATGSNSVNVKAGQNNTVNIQMGQFKFIVTFVTNGGNSIAPAYVLPGDTLESANPDEPTKIGYYCLFEGWYLDEMFENPYYSEAITNNITLYAKWTNYEIGDLGPAGGRIFYSSENGFTMTDDNSIAYYLEAAPVPSNFLELVASSDYYIVVQNTKDEIGTGRNNTALILDHYDSTPAAEYCNEHGIDTAFNDWFLPSFEELKMMIDNLSIINALDTNDMTYYWSSTVMFPSFLAKTYSVLWGAGNNNTEQSVKSQVRPIRAF